MLFAAFAVCRYLNDIVLALLFGCGLFLLWGGNQDRNTERAVQNTFRLAAASLLLTILLLLPLQTAAIAESWQAMGDIELLRTVALQTHYGRIWMVRLVGATLALIMVFMIKPRSAMMLLLILLLLVPLSLMGHAAMNEGWLGWLHRVNHFVHLLCAFFWLGSLGIFLYLLNAFRYPQRRPEAAKVLLQFSNVGHAAVAGVLVTGACNTALILQQVDINLLSSYQRLLGLKILLVAAMVGIAIINRYHLVPAMKANPALALHNIWRNTVAELILGVSALGIVATLGLMEP